MEIASWRIFSCPCTCIAAEIVRSSLARQTSQDIRTPDRPRNLKQMMTVKNLFVREQRINDSYSLLHDLKVFPGP